MKANSKIETVIEHLAAADLTASEFKVFLAWFKDANTFNASHQTIAERTGIEAKNVWRHLESLVHKGILQVIGEETTGRRIRQIYGLATRLTLPIGAKVDETLYAPIPSAVRVDNPQDGENIPSAVRVLPQNNLGNTEEGKISPSVKAEVTSWIASALQDKRDYRALEAAIDDLIQKHGSLVELGDVIRATDFAIRKKEYKKEARERAIAAFHISQSKLTATKHDASKLAEEKAQKALYEMLETIPEWKPGEEDAG